MSDANGRLLEPYEFGNITLRNRVVMAPLTRNRAAEGNVPSPLAVEYYAQRASSGLIITEATQVSPQGQGYQATPGIHSEAQVAGWKKVTDAVHKRGGRIFLQLWHVGRISHVSLQPDGAAPVAPSAIRAKTKTLVGTQFVDVSEPRELALDEIPGIVDSFREGARNADAAGFDGVEIHGANGYLLDQFMRDGSNKRTDDYGGSIGNRTRLLIEVTKAVIEEVGAERVGVRLSPVNPACDAADSDPQSLFNHVVEQLDEIAPLYIHVVEGASGGDRGYLKFDYIALRERFSGTYIANNGYTPELARAALATGRADLIAFGKLIIANPDLVERLRADAAFNEPDKATFYGGTAKGYTDYPTLEASGK
jgi:N-ethylmaleimide reductase